jgi:general secretion pathway protein D
MDKTLSIKKPSLNRRILLALLALQLSACNTAIKNNTLKANEHAQTAVQAPDRVANVAEHELKVKELLSQARDAWSADDLDKVQSTYQELATYDPGNLRAEQGLKNVAMARHHRELLGEAKAALDKKTDADDSIAMVKLHTILLERPDHPEAKPLYDALVKKQDNKLQEKLHKRLSYNNPVSWAFRDISLKTIFEALSKTTNISFILDKEVPSDQKATIFTKNMPFADALDLLCQTNQLDKKILSETSVIIYPNDPSRQRDYRDLSVRSYTLEYADIKQVSTTLRSMLNIRNLESDPRLNTIMIKDSPEVLALAEKVIQSLDMPDPEVMLEMEVLEVKRSRLQDLGVKMPTSLDVPIPVDGLTVRQLRHINSNDLQVGGAPGVNFSANDADVNLLANPRIRVKNKETARIHVGEKVPVFTANISSTGVSSETVQYIDAGLKLEAEPTISSSGDVTIKINLNVGSIGDAITNGQSTAFRVGTRSASTQLRLHDGETQILAGLIDDQDRSNVDKVPGIGDIPLLGKLFSKKKDDKSKTEIVLSITPHIVRDKSLGRADQNEYWIGPESQAGKSSPTPIFTGGEGVPFFVPKVPAPAAATKEEKPQSLNIPLPPGFSLGNGLTNGSSSSKPTD